MSNKVKYERLQDAKASVSARQGIYVYAPIAQQDRVGIVKGSDSVSIDLDGSIEVSDGFRAKVIQVFDTVPTDLTNWDNTYFIVDDVLYKVENGVANVANMKLSKVQATILADPTDSNFIGMEASTITIDILGTKFIFGQNEGSTNLPFYYTKSQIDGNINDIIDQIINGTIVAGKALRDSLGNVIKDSYVSAVYPVYNDTMDKLYIETYGVGDILLANNEVILPKATTTKNGLMSKEDKIKINSLVSTIDVDSAISTHNNDANSHLPLRTLINDLQKEVDRINAKGRSWGEVDKTFSELWAMAEPTRSDYINTFLDTAFSGYTPSNGDLVYTIVSDTEEEHELEYNSTLSQWVDNGAYIVGKASNTQMGIVKGDLTYVSILNGIIQVLKSDYATNIGSSGASYDYDDLLALFNEVANDIYKKNETYNKAEVDSLVEDIEDGTIVAGKAVNDDEGDPIVHTYANNMDALYNDTNNQVWIELKNKDGNPLVAKTITLPKATTSKDGLLAKEDKIKIDNIDSEIFIATFGTTTFAEITQALADGKLPIAISGDFYYTFVNTPAGTPTYYFQNVWLGTLKNVYVNDSDVWANRDIPLEMATNKVQTISASSTITQYPSAKAVYDAIMQIMFNSLGGES